MAIALRFLNIVNKFLMTLIKNIPNALFMAHPSFDLCLNALVSTYPIRLSSVRSRTPLAFVREL